MRLLVSAAEASADLHAAQVVAALRRRVPHLSVFGIGGPALRAQGLEAVARAEDLAVMGSFEVLSKFGAITAARRALLQVAADRRPEVALLVDYPGFHFNVAPKLRSMGTRIAYYIPPKVWVWRKGRLRKMKAWVDQVFCVLPFEAPLYAAAGIPAEFVGSPLVEELPWSASKAEARARMAKYGWSAEDRVLVVLPGSRATELENHLAIFLQASVSFAGKHGFKVVVVLPDTLDAAQVKSQALHQLPELSVAVGWLQGESGWAMRAADLGLIKSGTATLEAAILELPMVVAYRPGQFTSFAVKHLIRYTGPVSLANLYENGPFTRDRVVPEILHEEMTAGRLEAALEQVMENPGRENLARIRELALKGASGTPTGERVAAGLLRLWGAPASGV